jgi:hypothetical protein
VGVGTGALPSPAAAQQPGRGPIRDGAGWIPFPSASLRPGMTVSRSHCHPRRPEGPGRGPIRGGAGLDPLPLRRLTSPPAGDDRGGLGTSGATRTPVIPGGPKGREGDPGAAPSRLDPVIVATLVVQIHGLAGWQQPTRCEDGDARGSDHRAHSPLQRKVLHAEAAASTPRARPSGGEADAEVPPEPHAPRAAGKLLESLLS